MKKIFTSLSLLMLMAFSVTSCDYYKNHDQPVTQTSKCDSASMNSGCKPSVFEVAQGKEEKNEKKQSEQEIQIAKSKK